MTRLDFSPLNALTVGFDQVLNNLAKIPTFPPYNIEKTEEGTYKLTFAVAGFSKDFVEVKLKDNLLSVRGTMPKAEIPSSALSIKPAHMSVTKFATRLRLEHQIVGYTENNRYCFDLRTLFPEQDQLLADAIKQVLEVS